MRREFRRRWRGFEVALKSGGLEWLTMRWEVPTKWEGIWWLRTEGERSLEIEIEMQMRAILLRRDPK